LLSLFYSIDFLQNLKSYLDLAKKVSKETYQKWRAAFQRLVRKQDLILLRREGTGLVNF